MNVIIYKELRFILKQSAIFFESAAVQVQTQRLQGY